VLASPLQTRNFLQLQLRNEPAEVFCVLFMDYYHRVISFDRMFNGTIDGASVYPREIVRSAIKHNAASVIFAHNHPSGVAEPSSADKKITNRLKEALALIDVRVLDHFIVGEEIVSMAERGLM
jgi:DNA repair protein RadC